MTQWAYQLLWLLAARQDAHRVWGRFDHQRPDSGTNQFLMMVAAFILLLAAALIWDRVAGRPAKQFSSNSPRRLFRELCAAHGLNFSSRRLLKRLAVARGLANPAMLFVDPQHFDRADLPTSLDTSATELKALRNALFGKDRS